MLLNLEWYHEQMRPVMGRWMMLWLEANHVAGLTPRQVELFISGAADQYAARLASGGSLPAANTANATESSADAELLELMTTMEAALDSKCFKLLNLAKEWLRTFLPFW